MFNVSILQTKCESYLPLLHAKYNGTEVTVQSTVLKDGYTVRQLTIQVGKRYSLPQAIFTYLKYI